ncbi:hypothetical protein BH23BAC1_BH23BAC1_21760 [soil metagenome]
MKKDKIILYFLISLFLLFIWRFLIILDLPAPGADGPFFISKTFSLLRGSFFQNTFAYNYMQPDLAPYMYGLIISPFYGLFPDVTYSIFIFNFLVLIGITASLLYFFYIKRGIPVWVKALAILSIWISPYSYSLRPELFNIFLIIINFIFLYRYFQSQKILFLICSAILTTIIGLVHPVAGVFTVLATSLYFLEKKLPFKRYISWGALIVGLLCIIYLPIILIDPEHWALYFFEKNIVEDNHTFNPQLILKYIFFNPLLFALYISIIPYWTSKNLLKEILYLFIITLVLALFGRSYYYPYLGIFMILRISELSFYEYKMPAVMYAVLLISPFFTHYLPTIQQLENREYTRKFRTILKEVEDYGETAEENQVWVPASLCMPIIEKPGTRLHYNFYYLIAPSRIELYEGDRILVTSKSEINYIFRNVQHSKEDLEVTPIIPEVSQGLVTSSSFFRKRANPIGLWEIKLKDQSTASSRKSQANQVLSNY